MTTCSASSITISGEKIKDDTAPPVTPDGPHSQPYICQMMEVKRLRNVVMFNIKCLYDMCVCVCELKCDLTFYLGQF